MAKDLSEAPRIPLELVEWLEARQLALAPDAETADEAELRTYAAHSNLIRFLRVTHDDQVNPPEEDQPVGGTLQF
jgi:hypothetical protein